MIIKTFKVILASLALLALGLFIYVKMGPAYYAHVNLNNKSNKKITFASIEMCGEKVNFQNIDVAEVVSAKLKISSDCQYVVDITFDSGEEIHGEVGYVTHGLDSNDEIIILEKKIELQSKTSTTFSRQRAWDIAEK